MQCWGLSSSIGLGVTVQRFEIGIHQVSPGAISFLGLGFRGLLFSQQLAESADGQALSHHIGAEELQFDAPGVAGLELSV